MKTLHKNILQWEDIFNNNVPSKGNLTIRDVKKMVKEFFNKTSQNTNKQIKSSDFQPFLDDTEFSNQLKALAENNISAFELLSAIIGDYNFQEGIEKSYFYGFDFDELNNFSCEI